MSDCVAVLRWVALSFVGVALILLALPDALRDPRNYSVMDLYRPAPPERPAACVPDADDALPSALVSSAAGAPVSVAPGDRGGPDGVVRCGVVARRVPATPIPRLSSAAAAQTMTPR